MVKEIRIVHPDTNTIGSILIQPGKDMVTLMTCHPPNTGGKYRYLVYCERVTEDPVNAS
jgi:sortase A